MEALNKQKSEMEARDAKAKVRNCDRSAAKFSRRVCFYIWRAWFRFTLDRVGINELARPEDVY